MAHVNASNFTFLVEINRSFQPAFAEAQTEAVQVYRGILWQLERPIPVQGHVTDAETKAPLAAKIVVKEVLFTNGESNSSGGPFGRYQAFLPAGLYQLEFSAEGYATARRAVTVTDGGEVVLDVALTPAR